jgi:hypothetical protein
MPSSIQISKSARLTFLCLPSANDVALFILYINAILTLTDIYHLKMCEKPIYLGTLIRMIELLPQLISLKIHSLSLSQSRSLCAKEVTTFRSISNTNQIRKVYLEKINDIEEAHILIEFCPHMNYFQVNDINHIDIKLFVKVILIHIMNVCNDHLRYLCFRVSAADDQIVEQLKEMINSEKLLSDDYTIRRIVDHICLQWK